MNNLSLKNFFWIFIVLVIIAADQITKTLVVQRLPFEQAVNIWPVFSLYFTYNAGAAFSFLQQAGGWQEWLFGGIAIVVSIALIVWLVRLPTNQVWLKIALALVLGGSLGNLCDRIFFHHVIDFLLFYYNNYRFPAFNIADAAITTGATMLVIEIIFKGKKSNSNTLH